MEASRKEQIHQYMLKLIDGSDRETVQKTVETFGISKSTVYNYLQQLCNDGTIEKTNEPGRTYRLTYQKFIYHYANDGTLDEERIFRQDIAKHFEALEKNVFSAWRYAFTEMMNNAIEHSSGNHIGVVIKRNELKTMIYLFDDGIGIFRNIQQFMKHEKNQDLPLEDCISLLFAGKFTTARQAHSGEGIFFTSHLMDEFVIISDSLVFSRDSFRDNVMSLSDTPEHLKQGTSVYMALHNHSKKTTKEVFDRFSDVDEGFIRTRIPIAHFFASGSPISRSEARRLGEILLQFKEITLDFTDVEEVGQAFVHELFVVWQGRTPDCKLEVIHASPNVEAMIKRVLNTV